ncbi:MAG: sugar phosphate nucleotidyltransferase [bacterium]|nr:sugar phosphate nucleotidyltransferase [Candidatus Sumerlaeota bacterium]
MRIVAMLLAGGQGSRLSILAQRRAKPAVPFGGGYRIIDFTLSNVMHAEIPNLGILTQYKPSSLMEHVGSGAWWGFVGRHRMARILPPYTGEEDSDWYAGTADAICQNRNFIRRFDPELVLVVSGDHIYRMDYTKMIEFHVSRHAALTIALQPVPWEETSRFGLAEIDGDGRIRRFQEKPKSSPVSNLASLGIYVFDAQILLRRLHEDAGDSASSHDFGKDVIPAMLEKDRIYGYVFDGYWRDVGTIYSYWAANMEALSPQSGLDLSAWNLRTNYFDWGEANDLPARIYSGGSAADSLVARGCAVQGRIEHSILFPGVSVGRHAIVRNSIVMNDTTVGDDAVIDRCILDKECVIGETCMAGSGEIVPNKRHPRLLDTGITVIGKNAHLPAGATIGRNVLIYPGTRPDDLPGSVIHSGETICPMTE